MWRKQLLRLTKLKKYHVNNSKYFDWMIDPLGFDFLSGHVPEKIYLKYIKEVMYGVDVLSRADMRDKTSHHEIKTASNHAQAEITWREK